MCLCWRGLNFCDTLKIRQLIPDPAFEIRSVPYRYWVPGSTILNLDIHTNNFVVVIFCENLFYATWPVGMCLCWRGLNFCNMLKNRQNITNPAFETWNVPYRYCVLGLIIVDIHTRNFVGEFFWKNLFYATWTVWMCLCWRGLNFCNMSKNRQNITDPAFEIWNVPYWYWVLGLIIVELDIHTRNFVGEFFWKNLFYATWTVRACWCWRDLNFFEKLKNGQKITDPAFEIWSVTYKYWVPSTTLKYNDIHTCNFFEYLFFKNLFYAKCNVRTSSSRYNLKFYKKLKNLGDMTDPAFEIRIIGRRYWYFLKFNVLCVNKSSYALSSILIKNFSMYKDLNRQEIMETEEEDLYGDTLL